MKIPLSPRLAQIVARPLFNFFDNFYFNNPGLAKSLALKSKAQAIIAHDRALHGRELNDTKILD